MNETKAPRVTNNNNINDDKKNASPKLNHLPEIYGMKTKKKKKEK